MTYNLVIGEILIRTNVKFNEPGDVPGPVVQFEDDDQGDVKAGYGFESDNLYEGDWFFFHTDHLGSTSYLTDTAGNVSQFVCYTPYYMILYTGTVPFPTIPNSLTAR